MIAFAWAAQAQPKLQPIPPLTGRGIDTTGTLSAQDQAAIDGKLAALERDKNTQAVVPIIPTAALWVAQNGRRARIKVAKTLEEAVPDLTANRVIKDAITPAFRHGAGAAFLFTAG